MFGKADRVDGYSSVATEFFHLFWMPVAPERSMIVLDHETFLGRFRGIKVPISLKSILLGYIEAWFPIIAAPLAVIGVGLWRHNPEAAPAPSPPARQPRIRVQIIPPPPPPGHGDGARR